MNITDDNYAYYSEEQRNGIICPAIGSFLEYNIQ